MRILNTDPHERDQELIQRYGVRVVRIEEDTYPAAFKQLKDPPPVLYIKGKWPIDLGNTLGIVGSRICSLYGAEIAERISSGAARDGYVVISGLARGIDTAAHRGAVKTGRTIAVIGSGLAHLYPQENAELAEAIAKEGAIISEFPMDATPQKHHFPKRNRLVSALSQGMLLAEAPLKSGAMITMAMAEQMGKPCFCLPGRVDTESFQGNHALIKQGKAKLVENWEEMLSILKPGCTLYRTQDTQRDFLGLDTEELQVLSLMGCEEISIEGLSIKSGFPAAKLVSLLMSLVLKQAIREFPGKLYKRIHD